MEADAAALASPASSRDRDVDGAVSMRQQGPQLRGAAVAESCPLAAGKHRSEPEAFLAESGVANGVDAAVDSVEATRLDAPGDGALGDAGRNQLGKQDNPMLTGREPRDLVIGVPSGAFWTHTV